MDHTQRMLDFCDELESLILLEDASMEVKLGRAQHGDFLVTIQNATHREQYVVNLEKNTWIVFYGP